MEACDAHRRANNENERKFKEGVDTGGGPGVPRRAARRTQQLLASAREKDHWKGDDVRLPKAFDRELESGRAEH